MLFTVQDTIFQYQIAIVPLLLSMIFVFLLLRQCIVRKKLLLVRLVFSFILCFVCTLLLAFFHEFLEKPNLKNSIQWVFLSLDVILCLSIFLFTDLSSSKEQFNRDLFQTLNQTKYYVLVDKKNRIKEISTLFLEDLGLTEHEVYKKNLFDVIEKKYRIFKVNGTDADKSDLNIYYSNAETKTSQMNLELHDDQGDVIAYYFNETPIVFLGSIRGRMFVGDKKTSEELVGMEKNLAVSAAELDIIKSRFMSILEKTTEGIFFTDLTNKTVWLNDVLTKNLYLNEDTLSIQEFLDYIHPDDLAMYKTKLSMVNNINPHYSVSYRFHIGSKYVYVKEEGTRITNGRVVELCGMIRMLENYHYEKTQSDLDSVLGEAEMLAGINRLYQEGKEFQVVQIHMANLEEINKEFGRGIGNMVLSEYIKLIKRRYIDSNLLYRISGLDFIAVITDVRKMQHLHNDLHNKERILHVTLDYSTKKVQIHANMGICYSSDAKDAKDVTKRTKEALRFCTNPQFNSSYAYYRDIR